MNTIHRPDIISVRSCTGAHRCTQQTHSRNTHISIPGRKTSHGEERQARRAHALCRGRGLGLEGLRLQQIFPCSPLLPHPMQTHTDTNTHIHMHGHADPFPSHQNAKYTFHGASRTCITKMYLSCTRTRCSHTTHTHAHARTRTNILGMHHPRKAIGTFVSRDTRYKPFGSLSSSIPTPQAWRSLLVCLSA